MPASIPANMVNHDFGPFGNPPSDSAYSGPALGGITARVVTINPPVNPELRIIGRTETDNPDGSHTVTIKTKVGVLQLLRPF